MLGTYFYNKHVRTSVSIFGSLFDNIHVVRTAADGSVLSQMKVPLSYAPKRNFIERLEEMMTGEEGERRIAMKLPRMSFEIISIAYDPQRQLPKMNYFSAINGSGDTKEKFYAGTPYNLTFQLNVYAKTQDDALQVVEQIIPYFAPQYNVTIKPFPDFPDMLEDIPITITGVDFQDDYEGALGDRRTIIYTLNFDMRIMFYGPNQNRSIIREVNTDVNFIDPETFIENVNITPTPVGVGPDQDYGFNVEITNERLE